MKNYQPAATNCLQCLPIHMIVIEVYENTHKRFFFFAMIAQV